MEKELSDVERNAVVSFCQNVVMFNAVKKVVLHTIYNQGVLIEGAEPEQRNWVFGLAKTSIGGEPSDAQLGEELKACLRGLSYLEDGFKKLKEIKVEIPKKPKVNPAL